MLFKPLNLFDVLDRLPKPWLCCQTTFESVELSVVESSNVYYAKYACLYLM